MKPEDAVPEVLPHDHGRYYFDITDDAGVVVARVVVASWRRDPTMAESIARRLAAAYEYKAV